MAGNSEKIDEIIDPAALKQVDDLKANLGELEKQFADTLKGAIALNNATGGAKGFSGISQSAKQAAAETLKLQQIQDKAAITANQLTASTLRLQQQQQKIAGQTAAQSTEYQKLVQAYNKATSAAREAGVSFGTQSAQFIAAGSKVKDLRGQLDAIDQPLGNFQRNVGNYAGALENFGKKAFNSIRTIANILPGLGLSGAFLLIFEGLKFVAEQFNIFDKSVSTSKQTLEAYKSALSEGGAYTQAVKNVSELRENIGLAKKGFLDKTEVLKQYNDTIGKTTGQVSSLNEAENALNKNAEAYIKFTFLKATATAALEASSKKATEAQLRAVQDSFEGGSIGDKIKSGLSGFKLSSLFGGYDVGKILKKSDEIKDKEVKATQKESDQLLGIYDKFQKQAAELAKNNKFYFFSGKETTKAPDTRKQVLEQQLKDAKLSEEQILNNEKSSYDDRIFAIADYEDKSSTLLAKATKDKVITHQEERNHFLEIDKDTSAQRIKIAGDAEKELLKLIKEGDKEQTEILKNSLETADKFTAANKSKIQQSSDEALLGLADQYAKGLISTKQYNDQKKEIAEQTDLDLQDAEITGLKLRINIENSLLEDDQKDKDKLAELEKKRSKTVAEQQIADAEKVAARKKSLHDKEVELAYALQDFGISLVEAGFERRKNELQDQKNALDERTQAEIDAENRSLDSTSVKADKINIINAKAAAQKTVLDNKQKQADIAKAKFDKAVSIAKIIESTATGVAGALPDLVLAAIVGAIGAVQLATVIATPIPKYEKGTKSAKGGLSIWGEKGVELAIEPSGKMYTSSDTATFANIPRGTEIINNLELMRMIKAPQLRQKDAEQVPWKEVIKAINKQKGDVNVNPQINIHKQLGKKQRWDNYYNNHFKN